MSVIDVDKIDGMGVGRENNELRFLISDHLDWQDEMAHLIKLQEKINAYLDFIQSGQYTDTYPQASFETFVIEVHFKHGATESCLKFLNAVNKQMEDAGLRIKIAGN
ncbi:MAG: hypothetical protein LBV41_13550 [Cytophagaceae bacterium]|jgi:hypothetical protein|nr:hypothetical protein [Cytophagaceae bacterium]